MEIFVFQHYMGFHLVEEGDGSHKEAGNLLQALWIIVVADISMSIDNMLTVAGACKCVPGGRS